MKRQPKMKVKDELEVSNYLLFNLVKFLVQLKKNEQFHSAMSYILSNSNAINSKGFNKSSRIDMWNFVKDEMEYSNNQWTHAMNTVFHDNPEVAKNFMRFIGKYAKLDSFINQIEKQYKKSETSYKKKARNPK